MAGTMQGKVALITGGGSGIGRATSLRVAREGAKVMIADYNPDGAEKTVAMRLMLEHLGYSLALEGLAMSAPRSAQS